MDYVCTLCNESLYLSHDALVSFPCGHVFHKSCSIKWIPLSRQCSQCQFPIEDTTETLDIMLSTVTRPLDDLIDASAANHERGIKEALLESRLANKYLQLQLSNRPPEDPSNHKSESEDVSLILVKEHLQQVKKTLALRENQLHVLGGVLAEAEKCTRLVLLFTVVGMILWRFLL